MRLETKHNRMTVARAVEERRAASRIGRRIVRLPIDNPDHAEILGGATETSAYTVEGFRNEIRSLNRKLARIGNLIRLAETLSSEPRVKKTLKEALEV